MSRHSLVSINSHTKIKVGTLLEYSIFVQKGEAVINEVLLLLWTNSLISFFSHTEKPRLTGTVQKTRYKD